MLQAKILDRSIENRFEKRGAFRVSKPILSVEIEGVRFLTENWSLDGLLLNGLPEHIALEAPVSGIMGPVDTAEMCRFGGKVVRLDRTSRTTVIELDEKSADVAALLPLWVLKYGAR